MSQIKKSLAISTAQRAYLRAQAHALKPVVMIGDAGLSESVLKEINVALEAHGLIKIRVLGDDRVVRLEMLTTICEKLNCHAIQHIGKLLVIWRESETSTQSAAHPTNLQRTTIKRSESPQQSRLRTDAYDSLRKAGTKDDARRQANLDNTSFSNSPRERARQNRQETQTSRTNNTPRSLGSTGRSLGKRSFGDALQQRNPRPGASRTSTSRVHPLLAPASRKKRPVSIKKRSLGS